MPLYYNPYFPTSYRKMTLEQPEMEVNAKFIWDFLKARGWTLEATSALVANAQAESTINPARPQNNAVNNKWFPSIPGRPGDAPNPTTTHYGFGLWQITPFGALTGIKENPFTYGNWALDNGYTFLYQTGGTAGKMEPQLEWFLSGNPEKNYYNKADPVHNQRKWHADSRAPIKGISTPELFGKLTESPERCSETFYWNFERSGALNPGNRGTLARKWYNYLSGYVPPHESKILKGGKNQWRILHLIQS